jgi:hypothetical protein
MEIERLRTPGILGCRFRRAPSRSYVLPVALLITSLLSCGSLIAQSDGLTEDQIKAGFLFNFTKFVEWPPNAFPNASAPIVIAIVGDNPFGETLSATAAGKTVGGRAVVVKQFKDGQDLRACTILFISSSEKRQLAHIFESLKGSSVLTVSEIPGFARSGGMIAFLVEENKVRLEIDLDAALEARLKVSAKLIGVARLAPREPARKI